MEMKPHFPKKGGSSVGLEKFNMPGPFPVLIIIAVITRHVDSGFRAKKIFRSRGDRDNRIRISGDPGRVDQVGPGGDATGIGVGFEHPGSQDVDFENLFLGWLPAFVVSTTRIGGNFGKHIGLTIPAAQQDGVAVNRRVCRRIGAVQGIPHNAPGHGVGNGDNDIAGINSARNRKSWGWQGFCNGAGRGVGSSHCRAAKKVQRAGSVRFPAQGLSCGNRQGGILIQNRNSIGSRENHRFPPRTDSESRVIGIPVGEIRGGAGPNHQKLPGRQKGVCGKSEFKFTARAVGKITVG